MKPLLTSLIFAIILTLTSSALAQQQAGPQTEAKAFPYMAEIASDDVYIRSGPGTNYYDCGKFKKGDVVKVVAAQQGWSRIAPPPGSFSWISKQYVNFEPNSSVGTVTGDAVRVYAGSGHVKPLYSTTLQGKLNRQEKVRLLGEEKGGYLKIAPPPFAYLWVSSKFTNPLGKPVPTTLPAQAPPPVPVTPQPKEPPALSQPQSQTGPQTTSDKLAEYRRLENKIKEEKLKPINQQNYDIIKADLKKIAADKNAGKAARYAQYSLKNIERIELAQQVENKNLAGNEQLDEIMKRIINARDKKLAKVPDLGQYDAVGILLVSAEYSAAKHHRHYRIIDDNRKTVCYALPVGAAKDLDLTNLVGKKVGVIGEILPHPQSAGAMVEFTKISQIK